MGDKNSKMKPPEHYTNVLLTCPVCRTGIPTFTFDAPNEEITYTTTSCQCKPGPQTMKLVDYMDKLRDGAKPEGNCSFDSKLTTIYCAECANWLCPSCVDSQHINGPGHWTYDTQLDLYCNKHWDYYNNYCLTCKMNLCEKCVDEHTSHEIKEVKPADTKSYQKLYYTSMDKVSSDNESIQPKPSLIKPRFLLEDFIICLYYTLEMCWKFASYELTYLEEIMKQYQNNPSIPFNLFSTSVTEPKYEDIKTINEPANFELQSKTSQLIFACSVDNSIQIYNPTTYELMNELQGHSGVAKQVLEISPTQVVSSGEDRKVIQWTCSGNNYSPTVLTDSMENGTNIVLVDFIRVAVCDSDNSIKLYNTTTNQCDTQLKGHKKSLCYLAVLTDGTLASGSCEQVIKIWNTLTKKCLKTMEVPFTIGARIYPYDNMVYFVMTGNGIFLCNSQTEKSGVLADNPGLESYRECLKLRNGDIASIVGKIMIIHGVYGSKGKKELKGHDKNINTIAQLKSGLLASGAQDCTVRLWNPLTGACCQVLVGHSSMVMKVFAFDNGDLGTCSNKLIVWKPNEESSS